MTKLPHRTLKVALLLSTAITMPALAQDATPAAGGYLGELVLEGASYETEGSDSYTTDQISVGEKATMTPREVPQSTTVVTHRQIEDGGYTALETALADTPGLLILNNNVGRSSIYSRGYEFDYLYFDGLPAPVSSIYGTQPDLSIVDHVEVLKGPAGLFIGTGEPAGSINMRLKQATATEMTGSATVSVDSDGQARTEIDVSDKMNADGTLRGRVVAAYGDGDSFVDGVENGVTSLYGAVAWDITPDTELTFSISRMERDIVPFNGLPTYDDESLLFLDSSATTVLDWNNFENLTTDAVVAAEHFFDNGGRVKASVRRSHQTADFLYGYSGSSADEDNTISRLAWLARDFEQDSLAFDLHTEQPFALGGWDGVAIVGADWQRVDSTMFQARGAIGGSYDLDDWDTGAVDAPDVDYTSREDTDTDSVGLYSQVRLSPTDALTFIGGARLSWYDGTVKTTDLSTGDVSTEEYDVNGQVTPFAGATYDLSPNATVYASYSEIFIPQSELDIDGALLDPIEGGQFELGIKGELAYGLNASAALFDLREDNRPVQVIGEDYFVAEEEVRSRGVEFEVSGEVAENIHLAGGYTYTDTSFENGDSAGDTFSTYTPDHIFKLTGVYDVQQGALAGWSFGGRLTWMSEFSSRGIEAPSYKVVDLTAARTFDNDLTLRASVENIFDEEYYTRVGSTALFNFRGAPRTFNVSLTKNF